MWCKSYSTEWCTVCIPYTFKDRSKSRDSHSREYGYPQLRTPSSQSLDRPIIPIVHTGLPSSKVKIYTYLNWCVHFNWQCGWKENLIPPAKHKEPGVMVNSKLSRRAPRTHITSKENSKVITRCPKIQTLSSDKSPSKLMLVWQCHKPSRIHHHKYIGVIPTMNLMGGLWHCYTHTKTILNWITPRSLW